MRHGGGDLRPEVPPHSELLIAVAKSGPGLAVVPLLYVETELENKELLLPFGGPVPTADSYWLVQPEQRAEIPAAHQFALWIKDQARAFRRDVSNMRGTRR